MRLRHTTLAKNLASILKRGLLCKKSKGKMPVIWLHSECKTSWAFLHAVKRHGGTIEEVVSMEVDVPACWIKRSSVRGLYYVAHDVPPELIGRLFKFSEVARSPLEGRV